MKNNENDYSNVSPSVSSSSNIPVAMSPRGWKVSSAVLLGSARPVPCAKRCMWCSKLTVWSRAVKTPSAAFAFEGEVVLSSSRLNAVSVDLLMVVRRQAEWSKKEVCIYRVSIQQISKVLVSCYKSHFITFSCYHNHLQGHQVVISDTAKEFSTKLQREWSDQTWIALKMYTNRFPKIGMILTTQISALHCSYEKETDNF